MSDEERNARIVRTAFNLRAAACCGPALTGGVHMVQIFFDDAKVMDAFYYALHRLPYSKSKKRALRAFQKAMAPLPGDQPKGERDAS